MNIREQNANYLLGDSSTRLSGHDATARIFPVILCNFFREIYDIQANNAHRALDDVLVLHQVYEMMTDDLSIEAVHALLNQPRELRTMPFGKHRGQPLAKLPKTTSPGYLEAVPLTKQKIKPSKRLLQVSERFN